MVTAAGLGSDDPRPSSSSLRRFSVRGRPLSSVTTTSSSNKPPVLMEWGDQIVRVGWVGQAAPIQVWPHNVTRHCNMTPADCFPQLMPVLQNVYLSLVQEPSERKLVVLHSFGVDNLAIPTGWHDALERCVRELHIPAFCLVSVLHTIPLTLPSLQHLLLVHVSAHTCAQVVAYAAHAPLRFTHQAVPAGYAMATQQQQPHSCTSDTIIKSWTTHMRQVWLDLTATSLIMAILQCLQACPTPARAVLIANLVFTGEACIYRPDLPQRVAMQLRDMLQHKGHYVVESSTVSSDVADADASRPAILSTTLLPPKWTELASLASYVGVVDVPGTVQIRPDWLGWVGASMWCRQWHEQQEGGVVPWRTGQVM